MGSQQFCLRWNNHQKNLLSVFDKMLTKESYVDVTLACGGAKIKAHKVVLSACSPFFEDLFDSNPCKHPIVILKDMSFEDLNAIVQFMYKGEVNISQEQLSQLMKTAESLKIKGLAELGQDEQSENDNPTEVRNNQRNQPVKNEVSHSSFDQPKNSSISSPVNQPTKKQRIRNHRPEIPRNIDHSMDLMNTMQPSESSPYSQVNPSQEHSQNITQSLNLNESMETSQLHDMPSTSKLSSVMGSQEYKESHDIPIIPEIPQNIVTKKEPPEVFDVETDNGHSNQSEFIMEPQEMCEQEPTFDFESINHFEKDMSDHGNSEGISNNDELPMGMSYSEISDPGSMSHREDSNRGNIAGDQPTGIKPDGSMSSICKFCGQNFMLHRYLKKHIRSAHDPNWEEVYTCKFCNRVYNKYISLYKHVRANHKQGRIELEQVYTCKICSRVYNKYISLYHHTRRKHGQDKKGKKIRTF